MGKDGRESNDKIINCAEKKREYSNRIVLKREESKISKKIRKIRIVLPARDPVY